jgi:hypothetical protein
VYAEVNVALPDELFADIHPQFSLNPFGKNVYPFAAEVLFPNDNPVFVVTFADAICK